MNPVWIITGKEVRDSLRNRWVLAAALLLAALALSLGFLGSSPTGTVKVDPLTVTVVSLSSLSIFLIPLIAMLLSYDALIGEIERGTMALLLSYRFRATKSLPANLSAISSSLPLPPRLATDWRALPSSLPTAALTLPHGSLFCPPDCCQCDSWCSFFCLWVI